MPVFNNILAGAAGQGGATDYTIERSLRFNSADSAYLSRTPSSAGNRKTWTWSGWIKKGEVIASGRQRIFSARQGTSSNQTYIQFRDDNKLYVEGPNIDWLVNTDAIFRDLGAWGHLVVAFDTSQATASNRVRVYWNGVEQTLSGTQPSQDYANGWINNTFVHSIGNEGGAVAEFFNGYLAEIHFVDGQQLTADDFGATDLTTGAWNPTRFTGSHGTNGFHLDFSNFSSDAALGYDAAGLNNWTVHNLIAAAPTLKTITRFRFKTDWNWLYVSGVKVNGGNVTGTLDNSASVWSNTAAWQNGSHGFGNETYSQSARGDWFDVTLTSGIANFRQFEVHLYLDSSAGSTTNVFEIELFFSDGTSQTKVYPTTADAPNQNAYGFNSRQWQDFGSVGLALPKDQDSVLDSPSSYDDGTNIGGNYATFNPLDCDNGTLSNGNLTTNQTNTSTSFGPQNTTIGVSSGKWYCEFTWDSGIYALVGITHAQSAGKSGTTWHRDADTYTWYFSGAFMSGDWPNISTFPDGSNPTFTAGDVIGVLLDKDNDKLYFTKNGSYVASMNAATGANGIDISAHSGKTALFTVGNNASTATQWTLNAGQHSFAASSIPTGYKSLCTQNLDTPLVENSLTAFDVKTYVGNGSTQTVSGLNMSPDLVWLKSRSAASNHSLFDTVRGAPKGFHTNLTSAEFNDPSTLTAFTNDGWTMAGHAVTNTNNGSYVGWAWDAGSSNTTISAGSLNSSSYNSSRVWSNDWTANVYYSTYNATKVFDGDNSTGVAVTYPSTSTNIAVSPAISGSVIRVLYSKDNSSTVGTINGSETLPSTGSSATYVWRTLAATSISSIQLAHDNTGSSYIRAIEVDGKILLDQGVSAVDNFPSIASTCRTNQTAGISIVSYTGNGANGVATVGHNLNAPVDFMIIKRRSGGSASWPVWWSAFGASGNTDYVFLDAPDVKGNGSYDFWNNSSPTSSVFHISSNANLNAQNDPMIGYIFSSVEGFSKFGKYQGGSNPFVHTGFRPAFVAIKGAHSSHWVMMDAARDPYNDLEKHLHPNLSNAEATAADRMDFVSNGFKIRANYGESGDSQTYYYLAFAESPFKYSRAR